jgi:hypothetical protein
MSGITEEEQAFLKKIEERKIKHKEAQKKYRQSNKDKIQDYNKTYNENQKSKMNEIKSKLPPRQPQQPTEINIQEITQQPQMTNKKAKTEDIKPFFIKRIEPLQKTTIEAYISKADILQRFFIKKSLSQELKAELINLFNNNDFNEDLILSQMPYINNDIEPTINTLRTHYKNDNTFKTYINILVVITSHLKTLNKSIYQTLTKLNIYINNQLQDKRKYNTLEEADKNKIIDLDKTTILSNIQKLNNIKDRLIYGLYCLFPARREEWRHTKITTETNKEKLEDPKNNYLIISTNPKQIIFNNYKTNKTHGQQSFNINDTDLNNIIDEYILNNGLLNGDYLFSLIKDKNKVISQPNFSQLISDVFFKVYNIPISIRFLRITWVSNLLNKNPSIKEMEILAFQMAHGITEQGLYKKILK